MTKLLSQLNLPIFYKSSGILSREKIFLLLGGIILTAISGYFINLNLFTALIVLLVISGIILAFTDKETSIGEVVFNEHYFIINSNEVVSQINFEDVKNLKITYIRYKGKLHASDLIPRYNSYSGTDNYIEFEFNNKF